MSKTPSTPAVQREDSVPAAERRAADRTHREPWPEAMREEFRKIPFLASVDVHEVDPDDWRDTFAALEQRHVQFI